MVSYAFLVYNYNDVWYGLMADMEQYEIPFVVDQ